MIASTRDPESVKAGDAVPGFSKTFGAADLVAYGAATWDWHRLHFDQAYARSVKLPNVILDGQAYGALFARQARAWAGPRAFISKLGFRMRAMTFAGDTLAVEGEVKQVRATPEGAVVVLSQRLKLGDGRLAADCTTELRLPR